MKGTVQHERYCRNQKWKFKLISGCVDSRPLIVNPNQCMFSYNLPKNFPKLVYSVCTWHIFSYTTIFTQCTHSVHMVKVLHIFYICALCAYDMYNIYAAELQLAHMCATCIQDFCKGLFSVDLSCSEEPIMVTFPDMRYALTSMPEHIVPLTIYQNHPTSRLCTIHDPNKDGVTKTRAYEV